MFNCDNPKLNKIYMPKVEEIGNSFMFGNHSVMEVIMPNVKTIGNNFFMLNPTIRI